MQDIVCIEVGMIESDPMKSGNELPYRIPIFIVQIEGGDTHSERPYVSDTLGNQIAAIEPTAAHISSVSDRKSVV